MQSLVALPERVIPAFCHLILARTKIDNAAQKQAASGFLFPTPVSATRRLAPRNTPLDATSRNCTWGSWHCTLHGMRLAHRLDRNSKADFGNACALHASWADIQIPRSRCGRLLE